MMNPARRAMFAQWLCRLLPPFLAYRVHTAFFGNLIGSGIPFQGKALFGNAMISSAMNDHVDVNFALHGTMNFKGMVVALLVTKPGETIFELGANIGTETLALSNLIGPGGHVIAVEADPHLCEILRFRLRAARITNVSVVNMALSGHDGMLAIVRGKDLNPGETYVTEVESDCGIAVPAITADGLLTQFEPPSFVFMDIEGSEYGFLKGGNHLLTDARPIIFTEVIASYLHRSGGTIREFCKILDRYKYVAYDTDTRWLKEIDYGNVSEEVCGDWLIVPQEKLEWIPRIRRSLFRARIMPRIWRLNPLDTVLQEARNK